MSKEGKGTPQEFSSENKRESSEEEIEFEFNQVRGLVEKNGEPEEIEASFSSGKPAGVMQWGNKREEFDPRILFHKLPEGGAVLESQNKSILGNIGYSLLINRDDLGGDIMAEAKGFELKGERINIAVGEKGSWGKVSKLLDKNRRFQLNASREEAGLLFKQAEFDSYGEEFTPADAKNELKERIEISSLPEVQEEWRSILLNWDGRRYQKIDEEFKRWPGETNNPIIARIKDLSNGIEALLMAAPRHIKQDVRTTRYETESADSMRGGDTVVDKNEIDLVVWHNEQTGEKYVEVFKPQLESETDLRSELFQRLKNEARTRTNNLVLLSNLEIDSTGDDLDGWYMNASEAPPDKKEQYEKLRDENAAKMKQVISNVEKPIRDFEYLEKNWSELIQKEEERYRYLCDLFDQLQKAKNDLKHPFRQQLSRNTMEDSISIKNFLVVAGLNLGADRGFDEREPNPAKAESKLDKAEELLRKIIKIDFDKWQEKNRDYLTGKERRDSNEKKISSFLEQLFPKDSRKLREGEISDMRDFDWEKCNEEGEIDGYGRTVLADILAKRTGEPDLLVGRIYHQHESSGSIGYNLGNRDQGTVFLLLGGNIKKEGDNSLCWNGKAKIEGELKEQVR